MIKIGITDDHEAFRNVLASVFDGSEVGKVIVQAANGLELLKSLRDTQLDVVFLDLEMPVLDGFETLKRLQAKYPAVKVIIISLSHDDFMLMKLVKQGARGFIMKDAEPEVVASSIETVMKTGYFFDDPVGNPVLKTVVKQDQDQTETQVVLTEDEQQWLPLIAQQKPMSEIAQSAGHTQDKVEEAYTTLLAKLNVSNRNGIRLYALRNGIF